MLRKIFGPMREGVTQDWRKLHIYSSHNLYSALHVVQTGAIEDCGMARACGTYRREKKYVSGCDGET
jgi:hypothetical protein